MFVTVLLWLENGGVMNYPTLALLGWGTRQPIQGSEQRGPNGGLPPKARLLAICEEVERV
jgi:hypothetical protein